MEQVTELLAQQSIGAMHVHFDDYMTGQNASAFYFALQKSAALES